jgi:hypothetical protein
MPTPHSETDELVAPGLKYRCVDEPDKIVTTPTRYKWSSLAPAARSLLASHCHNAAPHNHHLALPYNPPTANRQPA